MTFFFPAINQHIHGKLRVTFYDGCLFQFFVKYIFLHYSHLRSFRHNSKDYQIFVTVINDAVCLSVPAVMTRSGYKHFIFSVTDYSAMPADHIINIGAPIMCMHPNGTARMNSTIGKGEIITRVISCGR